MEYFNSILEAIGNTPLIKLNNIAKNLKPQIFAKLESRNPGGSVKDRIGFAMIEEAEKSGKLKPGGTVVEATSGNTGIGLALTAAVKGYKSIFVVTDKVSNEKINYLKALGSEVIVVSNSEPHYSPNFYVTVAKRIAEENENTLFMYQYSNPANPAMHYKTTGPEIWKQTEGKITHFVAGMGTGGTISGTGKYLKEKNPSIKIIGSDPLGSILKAYKETGKITEGVPYLVEGIGQDCIPENVHFKYIDKIIPVSDIDSFEYARQLTLQEGIFCGGSTGTNLYAALEIAKDLTEDDIIVFVVADTGERYLSKVYNDNWLKANKLTVTKIATVKDLVDRKRMDGIKELVFVNAHDKVKSALEFMNKYGFSQLPVFEDNYPIGSIDENKILSSLLDHPEIINEEVNTLLGENFVSVDIETKIDELKEILRTSQAVLVSNHGNIYDIITRYDLISN